MCNKIVSKNLFERGINTMSRMKLIFVMLVLAAFVGIVPQVQATTTVEVTIAGSSAMWQTLALGAYSLACPGGTTVCNAGSPAIPAGHWTSCTTKSVCGASNVINLTDSRVTPVNVDAGTIWIVWNVGATKVWSFNKVDSVVGDRCYFAQPQCSVSATLANLEGAGSNQISSGLWGDGSSDSALPSAIQSLFTTGTPVTVAATDIRPEDAAFAVCRVNSLLGAGSNGGTASDGLDGLGYNSNWAAGVCPAGGSASSLYQGSPIKSGYPGSTSTANVLSFNIKGKDPISGTTIPGYTVVEVGATPIVFITERDKGQLANLTNASPQQLQQVFSGTNCDASAFGLAAGGIDVFLREPLSGTFNTAEATVFRHPTVYGGAVLGLSQETGVNTQNPLSGTSTCTSSDGKGARYRAIGTGEEVKSVYNSGANFGIDGIGYTFFSYGNVDPSSNPLGNNTAYGYITLNNIDPIFQSYGPQTSTGLGFDPGQPATAGTLPAAANLPTSCGGTFPCPESSIWANGLSFPNLRNGSYSAWSLVRLVSTGTPLTAAKALVASSQAFVVKSVPDYVPATAVKSGATVLDPGLELVRSHYQQYDGAGALLGVAPVNCGTKEAGGDMGGWIIPYVSGKCSTTVGAATTVTQEVQGNQGLQVRP
jgi:hypothetical protein